MIKPFVELQICEKLQPNNAVVFFEMGKNYKFQKQYEKGYFQFTAGKQIKAK